MKAQITKIARMGPAEINYRIKKLIYKKTRRFIGAKQLSDTDFLKSLKAPSRVKESPESLFKYYQNRLQPSFFFDQQNRKRTVAFYKKKFNTTKIIKEADKICANKITFFGKEFNFNSPIPWNINPVSGAKYEKRHHTTMQYGHEDFGDVKYIWELNRCEFLMDLGRAFFITGDERYAEKTYKLIEEWIEDNPYCYGINWTGSLEVAARAMSWLWAYFFTKTSLSLTSQKNLQFLKALQQHGQYLEKNLEIYESPFNHLIGEATGLFMIATLFPEFPQAKKWSHYAETVLLQNINRQFYDDGGSVEQAAFYHHYCLGFIILYAVLKKKNGPNIEPSVLTIIEKAIEFSQKLTKPDGKVPMIGDTDSARSIYVGASPPWDFRDFHCIGAILFNRPDMKYCAGKYLESAYWLLGEEGYRNFSEIKPEEEAKPSCFLPESGYVVMKEGGKQTEHYLNFFVGSQGEGLHKDDIRSAAHGHADALSFVLAVNGEDILIDPAIYTYNGEQEWESYFRCTSAHNTIKIDGIDQSNYHGSMTWSNVFTAKCNQFISNQFVDYAEAEHDGYVSQLGITHKRRTLFRKPHYWIIQDFIEGSGSHKLESFLHFSPEMTITEINNQIIAQDNQGRGVNFFLYPDNNIKIKSNGTNPDEGWSSKGYGEKIHAPVVVIKQDVQLPYSSIMVVISSSVAENTLGCDFTTTESSCHVVLKNGTHYDDIYLQRHNLDKQHIENADISTDA